MTTRVKVQGDAAFGPVSEEAWKSRVIETARLHGWMVVHQRPSRTARGWRTAIEGDRGFPDLVLARDGVVILAELKSAKGRFGPGQREWLAALGPAGRCWRPADWPRVLAELSARSGHRPAARR